MRVSPHKERAPCLHGEPPARRMRGQKDKSVLTRDEHNRSKAEDGVEEAARGAGIVGMGEAGTVTEQRPSAAPNTSESGSDVVSAGIKAWLLDLRSAVVALQLPRAGEGGAAARVESEGSGTGPGGSLEEDLRESLGEMLAAAGCEALALTRDMRKALVADAAAAGQVAAGEGQGDGGKEEEEEEEGLDSLVVDRHRSVLEVLACERVEALTQRIAAAQDLLARLSERAASAPVVAAEVAERTRELCRVGAVLGLLGAVAEEAAGRAERWHRASCKLSLVLLGVLGELVQNGFCRKPEEAEEGDDIEGVEGMGMGECEF